MAAKQLFCFECRCHNRRPKVWANRILRLLDARLDQPKNVMVESETHDSALLVHPWPSSMFYSVVTSNFNELYLTYSIQCIKVTHVNQ